MTLVRVLVTGGAGQLAHDLDLALGGAGVHRLSHRELDVTDDDAVRRALEATDPAVVFNCAAFHNVDECERAEDTAAAVNVRAVKRLAEACDERGARLVHFSTNYVFDGSSPRPYGEDDRPNPRSVYAITKLAGEHAALAYCERALVVRSAGLYGLAGSASKRGNFVQRMVERARRGEALRVVSDQRLSPTFTADLAPAVIAAVEAGATGILHLTSSGACSWHEFAAAILAYAGIPGGVEEGTTERRPGAAERPLNGALARGVADELGLRPLRPWQQALTDYMDRAGLRGT